MRRKAKAARELLRDAELRRLAELRSLRHTDAQSFDADLRVGAVLVTAGGVVIARRIERPRRSAVSKGATSVSPWGELPEGHPRADEDRDRSESALRLDRAQLSGAPWL